jgi:hypothetical protein
LLAIACALLLAAGPATTPDAIYKLAARDLLERVPPERRKTTRYLSLHAVPEAERAKFYQSLVFALNSVSFRTQIGRPLVLGDDRLLVRIDLESLGWDFQSRVARRARLALSGVKFDFKGDAAAENRFLDIWEDFVARDPYWKVTAPNAKGVVLRGWLDPVAEQAARDLSGSSSFILRADWLMPRLLVEKDQGGFYSQILMFPAREGDLYKFFGIDINLVDRENQLKQGGAVLESVVALHNRELQLIPSLYGYDERFIWRTFDVLADDKVEKNVLETFGGALKHDGREIIGTLPNGLHWYYLADAAGRQVSVVPQAIALDMRRDPFGSIRDRSVVNAYKCIACHGPTAGTQPFDDVVSKAIVDPRIALAVVAKDKRKVADRTQALEDYYLSGLAKHVARQQSSYADRVVACNDLDAEANAERLIAYYDRYVWDLVTPQQAAAEIGYPPDQATGIFRNSGNSQLAVLSTGQPLRRAAWEQVFGEAMRSVVHPWESAKAKGY